MIIIINIIIIIITTTTTTIIIIIIITIVSSPYCLELAARISRDVPAKANSLHYIPLCPLSSIT